MNPSSSNSFQSSIKADLEPHNIRSLDLFAWIDFFRTLVYDTTEASKKILALLKRHLKVDCLDVLHGLGGGEEAYIEALVEESGAKWNDFSIFSPPD